MLSYISTSINDIVILHFPHKKLCLVRLYPPVVYRRAHVLFTLFVFACA